IREAVLPSGEGVIAVFERKLFEPSEDARHFLDADRIEPLRVSCRGRETNRIETDFLRQMLVNPPHLRNARTQCDPRSNRISTMSREQRPDPGNDDLIAAAPI